MPHWFQCPHNALQDEAKASYVAEWTVKSDQKMRQLTVQRRLEALNNRREADLQARRQRLAEKLYAEDVALRQELVDSRETPEQRRAKLAARARELAERREAQRQTLAAELYEQAFMENCDVLRDTNSKRVLYRTLDERASQVRAHVVCMPRYSGLPQVIRNRQEARQHGYQPCTLPKPITPYALHHPHVASK